jgi:hypothetical protein
VVVSTCCSGCFVSDCGQHAFAANGIASEVVELRGEHAWAGKYHEGGGLTGEYLCVAPRAGYVRWQYHDAGPDHESALERGSVHESDGVLHLTPDSDSVSSSATARDLILVTWGERRYLIPGAQRARFCAAIAHGSEPRREWTGEFFLREGDERLPPEPIERIQPSSFCR